MIHFLKSTPRSHTFNVILFCLLVLFSKPAVSAEFTEESEKDYKLRSIGKLFITNMKGDVTVQGWALDKIRVKLKKTIVTEQADKAPQLFAGVDYRFQISKNKIEITSQYGKDLSIEDRLKEKENPKMRMDLVIYAPSNLDLAIWAVHGKVQLKSWNSQTEIRTNTGSIRVENLKGKELSVSCTSCQTQLKNLRASVRCMGGEGPIDLDYIVGKRIYAETSSGNIKLWHIQGDQLYTSKSGVIEGQHLRGALEFHQWNFRIRRYISRD
jgi:DUF4097 and DUF4098 domain-containing protein YvlB